MENRNQYIENKITNYLLNSKNHTKNIENKEPRAIGELIQKLITSEFDKLFGDIIQTFVPASTRKSMADMSYYDEANNYYAIDIKTHRLDSVFNMPNLISVKVLDKFYQESKQNNFMILKVDYSTTDTGIKIEKIRYNPIEFYDWKCLRIGALGWGQIQIANSNNILVKECKRARWMASMCNKILLHYENEMKKIEESRIMCFNKAKQFWEKEV